MNGVEEPSRTRSAPATGLSVTIASARSGDPVLRVGEHWLDDPDDPVVAAARFADEEQVQGVDRVVLFGAGLGYRLARLRALGVPHVHAFEPLPRLLQLGRERYPDRFEGAALHTDAGALLEALVESGRPDEHLLLLTTRAYQALFPAALRSVQEAIVEAEAYQRMRHDTLRLRSAAIVEAGVRNLRGLAGSRRPPDLGGLPVFLIGAGPSLDRNAAGLEAAARKGLLVAVNTSAPVLIERNLPIDLLVSIESLDVSENLRRAAPSTSMIALELTANAESAAVLGPERAFFEGTTPLGIAEALGLPRLEHPGNVMGAALSLCASWGASPILLLGQDCALLGDRLYASGTGREACRARAEGGILLLEHDAKTAAIFERGGIAAPRRRQRLRLPAWGGVGEVESMPSLAEMRRWLSRAPGRWPGRTLINATEGGARIEGLPERTLASILARLPDLPASPDRAELLPRRIQASPRIEEAELAPQLLMLRDRLRAVRQSARECQRAQRGRPRRMEQLREAARLAPAVNAHAAGPLLELRAERLDADARARRTFEIIEASAARLLSLLAA